MAEKAAEVFNRAASESRLEDISGGCTPSLFSVGNVDGFLLLAHRRDYLVHVNLGHNIPRQTLRLQLTVLSGAYLGWQESTGKLRHARTAGTSAKFAAVLHRLPTVGDLHQCQQPITVSLPVSVLEARGAAQVLPGRCSLTNNETIDCERVHICSEWRLLRTHLFAPFIRFGEISMPAIVYSFIRATSQPSNLAVIIAFSLAGLVLTLAALRFGLDFGSGILG